MPTMPQGKDKKKMNEKYMIYVKKNASDTVFDYKTTADSWEKCVEKLEHFAKDYEAVSYLNIEENGQVSARTFYFNHLGNELIVYKVTGGVISL